MTSEGMSPPKARKVLHDALVGEGAYARSFAPEYSLIPIVAPALTKEQVLRLGSVIPHIQQSEVRTAVARSLEPMFVSMSPSDLGGTSIGALSHHLPSLGDDAVLEAIESMGDQNVRMLNLEESAPRLSADSLERAERVTDGVDRLDASRALQALAVRSAQLGDSARAHRLALASAWPALGLALVGQHAGEELVGRLWLVEAVVWLREYPRGEWIDSQTRVELARAYAARGDFDAALGMVKAQPTDSTYWQGETLTAVVEVAPAAAQERFLALGEERLSCTELARLYAGAASSVADQDYRSRLLERAVEAAMASESEYYRLEALGPLLPLLDPASKQVVLDLMVVEELAVGHGPDHRSVQLLNHGLWFPSAFGVEPSPLDAEVAAAVKDLLGRLGALAEPVLDDLLFVFTLYIGSSGNGAEPADLPGPMFTVPHPGPAGPELAKGADEKRVVNTGFAPFELPDNPLDHSSTLIAGEQYWFWLSVGSPDALSIGEGGGGLPPLPAGDTVTVVLSGGGLEHPLQGVFSLDSDGTSRVTQMVPGSESSKSGRAGSHLLFGFRAPARPGWMHLTCTLYCRGVLLQSRAIDAWVTATPESRPRSLRSFLKYSLANSLTPALLEALPQHTVSLRLTPGGVSSLILSVAVNADVVEVADVSLSNAKLVKLIDQVRGALRRACWGASDEWDGKQGFRYSGGGNEKLLADDLGTLAKNGANLYSLLIETAAENRGVPGYGEMDRLTQALRGQHVIQLALDDQPDRILPISVLYDFRIDTGLDSFVLCETFLHDLRSGQVATGQCIRGECRQAGDEARWDVVCPGGFWGFRHALGMPVSVRGALDAPVVIGSAPGRFVMDVASDLKLLAEHTHRIRALLKGGRFMYQDTREGVVSSLVAEEPDVVYFYCHGGLRGIWPYLRVGPKGSPVITDSFLKLNKVAWPLSRPLVFVNGCRTAEVGPQNPVSWPKFFVGLAGASAVVGTEITVYEELATTFAEHFFQAFIDEKRTLGEAIRRARVDLLSQCNPLGLAYLPFGLAGLAFEGKF